MTDELMDFDTDDNAGSGGFRPSRRTVLAAAAWTVPAVIIAQAAPALAATQAVGFGSTGTACKLPGNSNDIYKGYAFGLTLTNGQPCPTTVTITSMSIAGNGLTIGKIDQVNTQTAIPACTELDVTDPFTVALAIGETKQLAIYTINNVNSQAGVLLVNFSYIKCNGETFQDSSSVNLTGSTWNSGCRPFSPTTWDSGSCPEF